MKKFTKFCLVTALVLFLVGMAISVAAGVLGGFKQLREMEEIGGIPLNVHVGDGRGFGIMGMDVGKDWEKDGYMLIPEGRDNGISMNAASFTELNIELGACRLYLEETEDDYISVWHKGDTLRYYWMADGSEFCIRNAGRSVNSTNDEVHVRIPKGKEFKELEIDFGAGMVIAETPLSVREADITMSAGSCEIQELKAGEAELTVGAGSMEVAHLNVQKLDIEVGAGELIVDEIMVGGKADITMSMGSATIEGTITGDLFLECDMGDVTMQLTGAEEEHSYTVDCGLGEVQIGRDDYGGFASEKSWNSGKQSCFDIECNMGTVTIQFEE